MRSLQALGLVATLLVLLAGCGGAETAPPTQASTAEVSTRDRATPQGTAGPLPVLGAGYSGVIIAAEQARAQRWYVKDGTVDDYWTPTLGDIEELEATLRDYLALKHAQTSLPERYEDYQRQYVGYVEGGARRIFGTYICTQVDVDLSQPAMILDGGECIFKLTYDQASKSILWLMIHGEA